MLKIVVTGNIGSGKSTIMQILTDMGEVVFDSDAQIKDIYLHDKDFYEHIKLLNKDYVDDEKVLKEKIIADLSYDATLLQTLETFLYPILHKRRLKFLLKKQEENLWAVFFEIPLLFEKNLAEGYDKVILLYASKDIRLERVLKRHSMTKEKFEYLNSLQIEPEKILDKIFVSINTEDNLNNINKRLQNILQELKG